MNSMETETWKDIPNYPPYQISSFGRVRALPYSRKRGKKITIDSGRILKQFPNKNWAYLYIMLSRYKKGFRVHRLVAQAFIPNPQNKAEVNHKDGNKLNNHISNLEWNTASENSYHAYSTGLKKASLHRRKLTDDQIFEIRYLKYVGASIASIAREFGLHITTVYNIFTGKSWA